MGRITTKDAPIDGRTEGLRDVHELRRLRPYMAALWGRRAYMWNVSTSELRARQMTSALGNIWHLLNPALQITTFYIIFGLVLSVDRGVDNFIAYLTVGIFVFGFTQRTTTAGARSIIANRGMLNSLSFPRALLPVTSSLTESLATISPIIVMYLVALLTGEVPRWQWLLIIPLLGLQLVMNLGLAMVAARATSHVRDVLQVLPFVFRLLLYASGVLFNVEAYASSKYAWIFYANPVYCAITIARSLLLGGTFPPVLLVSLAAWSVGLCVFGFLWFRRGEAGYGRD